MMVVHYSRRELIEALLKDIGEGEFHKLFTVMDLLALIIKPFEEKMLMELTEDESYCLDTYVDLVSFLSGVER